MPSREKIEKYNSVLLRKLSVFLNAEPDFITPDIIRELTDECGLDVVEAYSAVLAASLGFDTVNVPDDRELTRLYFPDMLRCLDPALYAADPYYRGIRFPETRSGRLEFKLGRYKPFEAFACGDLRRMPDGRLVPQLGFFSEEFKFPEVTERGREWMLITPNELETMRPAVAAASGRVLTYGLGLGYFAYMASLADAVSSVTIVERDGELIRLFERYLLPQFPRADKLTLVRADAFDYADRSMAEGGFDFVFTDLWHDPSDGVELYLRMKRFEGRSPKSRFMYWIEPTLRCYIK